MSFELVSERDGYETRTGSDGESIEVREVREVRLTKTMGAGLYSPPNDAFTTKGVLTFLVNGSLKTKSLSNPKKFLCTEDDITREDLPGAGLRRSQTWVYYSEWAVTTAFGN